MANRLAHEDSPYLQQHKDNPVDWYPWCDEAFQKAAREKKAIFLSIGYSSCHWCHVMEREVFENETLAAYLNEHFISIKVDKEERPDIDKHYQELYMLLNRRAGGWPLSIFLTPQNKAFYAATYIPPTKQMNMMGFDELTKVIAEKIASDDSDLFKNADEIQRFMQHNDKPKEGTKLNLSIIETYLKQIGMNFDTEYGGFSVAPKFPHTSTLQTLLDIYQLTEDQRALSMVTQTLDAMHKGGMYDLVDGGFCRYSTDQKWLVPHFEKMTYDNALLSDLYVRSFELTGNEAYKQTAFETLDFMLHFMQKDHLFFSASDADTQGVEGKYFVYGYEKTRSALLKRFDPQTVTQILDYFDITPDGNFEGSSIPSVKSMDRPDWYEQALKLLKSLRDPDLYPFIDHKVITAWQSMMVQALYKASLHEARYRKDADAALKALLDKLYVKQTLYHTSLVDKEPAVKAFLEDYAYLGRALISAYQVTFDEQQLLLAQKLANDAIAAYYKEGAWNFSDGEFVTKADITDNSYPGSVAVMTDLLISLGRLIDPKYEHIAFKTLEYNSYKTMRTPAHFPYLTATVIRHLSREYIFKLPSEKIELSRLGTLRQSYPFILLQTVPGEDILVCDQQSCYNSVTNLDQAIAVFNELASEKESPNQP